MAALADRALQPGFIATFAPVTVATVAWAFARLYVQHPALFGALAEQALRPALLPAFQPREIVALTWAWARLQISGEPLLGALADHIVEADRVPEFKAAELCSLAWAYAKLSVPHAPLLRAIASHVTKPTLLQSLDPRDVATLAYAFAKLRMPDTALFEALAERALALPDANAQDVAVTAWAFARVGVQHQALLSDFSSRATDATFLDTFRPQELATFLWACAKSDVRNGDILEAITIALQKYPLNPQQIAMAAWSFAKLGELPSALFEALASQALRPKTLHSFRAREVCAFIRSGLPVLRLTSMCSLLINNGVINRPGGGGGTKRFDFTANFWWLRGTLFLTLWHRFQA